MRMSSWSTPYAYVDTKRCACADTIYALRGGGFLLIRPDGEQRLQRTLNDVLVGTRLSVLGVSILPRLHQWTVVLDISDSGEYHPRDILSAAMSAAGVTGHKSLNVIRAGQGRWVANFIYGGV